LTPESRDFDQNQSGELKAKDQASASELPDAIHRLHWVGGTTERDHRIPRKNIYSADHEEFGSERGASFEEQDSLQVQSAG
jgi:hypothetical protein